MTTSNHLASSHINDQPTYLDRVYDTLFHPITAFQKMDSDSNSNQLLFEGLLTIIGVSAIAPILHLITHGGDFGSLAYEIPIQAVMGIVMWLFIAFLFSMIAYAFTERSNFRKLLILSAYATLPWLFLAPLTLVKTALGVTGDVIHTLIGLVIWIWTVLLFALALMKTYQLSADRVIIILLVPILMSLVATAWVSGFIVNIMRLLPES
jgi:hypothetical protein